MDIHLLPVISYSIITIFIRFIFIIYRKEI